MAGKGVARSLRSLFINNLMFAHRNTISFDSMRFLAFFVGTTFILPSVSLIHFLKIVQASQSGWIQYNTPRLLCVWRSTYLLVPIPFSGNSILLALFLSFQFCYIRLPILKDPSINFSLVTLF